MAHPSDERENYVLRTPVRRIGAVGLRLGATALLLLLGALVPTGLVSADPAPAAGTVGGSQSGVPGDSLPVASAEISTDSVAVGDRFTVSVIARHRGDRRILLPSWSDGSASGSGAADGGMANATPDSLPRLGDLRVLSVGPHRVRSGPHGTRTDSVAITVTTFALDSARVPAIPVRMAGETDTLEIRTAAHTVGVRSLVPADARELRDLAPIASFARPLWPWLAGALGALAAVAAAVYWMRREDEEDAPAAVAETRIDPYQEAQDRLDALGEYEFEGADRIKPFFIELADCLRTLIHRTQAIPAHEMTTSELLGVLRGRSRADSPDEEVIRRFEVVLRLCDLAKFADARPPAEDSRSALRAARDAVTRMEAQRDRRASFADRSEHLAPRS